MTSAGWNQPGKRHRREVGRRAAREAGLYEVVIEAEACVLHCEVTNVVDEAAHLTTWESDRDALGYREMEFRATSGEWLDPEGNTHDLGRNGCAEVADRYAEYIEEQLWRQIDAHRAA